MTQGIRPAGRVTIADVAIRAGVTSAVVSRLINNNPNLSIRPETRARVLAAIDDLGYRPNAAARSLSRSKSDAFGLIIPDFENPVYAKIIEGAESAAVAMGCVLLTGSAVGSGLSSAQYIERLGNGRVDGLLLAGTEGTSSLDESTSLSRLPFLMLNRRAPGVDRYLVLDDEGAAALAVSHLTGLGHSRIAHIAGPNRADTGQRRLNGYSRAMQSAGVQIADDYVASADYTPAAGMHAMQRLLSLPEPPTAVFVASIASAIGALRAAMSRGVDVPDQISVVAVHDLPLAAYLSPPLTTVRMPLAELGARGLQLLADKPADADITEVFGGPMQLILRESTAAPRRTKRITITRDRSTR